MEMPIIDASMIPITPAIGKVEREDDVWEPDVSSLASGDGKESNVDVNAGPLIFGLEAVVVVGVTLTFCTMVLVSTSVDTSAGCGEPLDPSPAVYMKQSSTVLKPGSSFARVIVCSDEGSTSWSKIITCGVGEAAYWLN